jgi:signal peptidase
MRHHLISSLGPLLAISNLFIVWKCCCIITGSDIPIVVVISESMAPAFHRGDLLLLWNRDRTVRVGDVPLVWFPNQHLPMLHRAVQSHWVDEEIPGGGPVYVPAEFSYLISSALFISV